MAATSLWVDPNGVAVSQRLKDLVQLYVDALHRMLLQLVIHEVIIAAPNVIGDLVFAGAWIHMALNLLAHELVVLNPIAVSVRIDKQLNLSLNIKLTVKK